MDKSLRFLHSYSFIFSRWFSSNWSLFILILHFLLMLKQPSRYRWQCTRTRSFRFWLHRRMLIVSQAWCSTSSWNWLILFLYKIWCQLLMLILSRNQIWFLCLHITLDYFVFMLYFLIHIGFRFGIQQVFIYAPLDRLMPLRSYYILCVLVSRRQWSKMTSVIAGAGVGHA